MSDPVIIVQNAIEQYLGVTAWPTQLPDAPEFPCVVVTLAGGRDEYDMDGDTGLLEARVQVDVYAEGYAACVALKEQVRQFLVSRNPIPGPACAIQQAMCNIDTDLPAPEFRRAGPQGVRRRMLDFTIWTRRA